MSGCQNIATSWTGNVIKSRDVVIAGFCDKHKFTKCVNAFGKIGCFGLYDKTLGLIYCGEFPKEVVDKNIIEQ